MVCNQKPLAARAARNQADRRRAAAKGIANHRVVMSNLSHAYAVFQRATFSQRLDGCAAMVEQRLGEWLTNWNAAAIPDFAPAPRLVKAMKHSALGGGKRFRPFLLIESAALFGVSTAQALDAGVALECVHCYSLTHDDLPAMDDDDMRRGQPTVHKAYDEATAILAGDGLLTLAFEILASPGAHPDPAVRASLALQLARASGAAGMAGGQMLDLQAPGGVWEEAAVERMQSMKTGALIIFAAEAGAVLGQAGDPEREALRAYGVALGKAFQLADDLLDATGDASAMGKAAGKDHAAGKATLVALLGVEAAQKKLAEFEARAIEALRPFGSRASTLIEAARFAASRSH
jgi:farnesyl diphosphate synthase